MNYTEYAKHTKHAHTHTNSISCVKFSFDFPRALNHTQALRKEEKKERMEIVHSHTCHMCVLIR